MRSILLLMLTMGLLTSSSARVCAHGEPDFDLEALINSENLSMDGSTATMVGEIILVTSDNDHAGAQGWSLSVAAAGQSSLTVATTAGTVGADKSAGGLRDTGFEKTELTVGDGNAGAVSAVVLSFTLPVTLEAVGEVTLLKLEIEFEMPEAGCVEAGLVFQDGLRGSGQPVDNKITWQGKTRRDDGGRARDPDGNPFDNDEDGMRDATTSFCVGDLVFTRGDCDANAALNLTDAIFALNHLFLAGEAPSCPKSCDVTDDGAFNLTDPINLLNHLFLGGPSPSAPHPDCGVDPTEDTLTCNPHPNCL